MSEVPLGAFLSGGVDSSASRGLMASRAREDVLRSVRGRRLHERPYARDDRPRYGPTITSSWCAPTLPRCFRSWWSTTVNPMRTPRAAQRITCQGHRDHVRVALTGDGGTSSFAATRATRRWVGTAGLPPSPATAPCHARRRAGGPSAFPHASGGSFMPSPRDRRRATRAPCRTFSPRRRRRCTRPRWRPAWRGSIPSPGLDCLYAESDAPDLLGRTLNVDLLKLSSWRCPGQGGHRHHGERLEARSPFPGPEPGSSRHACPVGSSGEAARQHVLRTRRRRSPAPADPPPFQDGLRRADRALVSKASFGRFSATCCCPQRPGNGRSSALRPCGLSPKNTSAANGTTAPASGRFSRSSCGVGGFSMGRRPRIMPGLTLSRGDA
jgi:hypothetical protein